MTTNPPAASDGRALSIAEQAVSNILKHYVLMGRVTRSDLRIAAEEGARLALANSSPPASGAGVRSYPGLPMSDADLTKHYEASKSGLVAMVGSEVRQIIGELRHLRTQAALPTAEPEPAIPAGMVPWHGGDSAPGDWDQGVVLLADGTYWQEDPEDGPIYWGRDFSETGCIEPGSVIAYTPKPQPAPSAPAAFDGGKDG